MNKMKMESVNLTAKNIDKIGELFPNCITESPDGNGGLKKAINFDVLKQMLSEDVLEGNEAYDFTWVGKKSSMVEANKPIRKTLRPCKEESVNWDSTENLYIEGDNLEVLKLLQESYLGKVKMIYIDPPYNTGNDFIYKDDFKQSREEYNEDLGIEDEDGNRMFQNNNSNGRFHSDWCSMIYSRLLLARNLLSDDGVVFISIDDNEVHNLRKISDEVFGEKNFIGDIIRKTKSTTNDNKTGFNMQHENTFIFSKNKDLCFLKGEIKTFDNYKNPDGDPNGEWISDNPSARTGSYFEIKNPHTGKIDFPPENRQWLFSEKSFSEHVSSGKIKFKKSHGENERGFIFKRYKNEVKSDYGLVNSLFGSDNSFMNQAATKQINKLFPNFKAFDYTKPVNYINRLIKYSTNNNDIILDFFSGSATTAHAVMDLNAKDGGNRKFIMVQLPEVIDEKSEAYKAGYKNICEIGKERIRRASKKIQEENPNAKFDSGFRVLKIDDSNMKDVYYSANEYNQDLLETLESNIKEDRKDLDLLFGCLLEWGLPLSMPYTSEKIEGATVHTYNDGDLIACFDENISNSVIKTIAKRAPLRAVFRDSSFDGSPAKINVGEIFKLLAPNTSIKVI